MRLKLNDYNKDKNTNKNIKSYNIKIIKRSYINERMLKFYRNI